MRLEVEKLVAGGAGLARLADGEVILLAGALPGETVAVEVGPKIKGVRRGRLREVLEPSPLRVEPDCPLAGRCGGCDFLHVRPEAALDLKSRAALGEMADGFRLALELVESPHRRHYRCRATLHLGPKDKGGLGAGFFDARRRLVEFEHCRLLAPTLNDLARTIRLWAAGLSPAWAEAEVGLAVGEDDSGQAVVVSPRPAAGPGSPKGRSHRPPPDFQPRLAELAAGLAETGPDRTSVFGRSTPQKPPEKINPEGPDRLVAAAWPEWDLNLRALPGGFTQVNPLVNRLMVEEILELAAPLTGPGAAALDLYAGLGNISLPLVKNGFAVTAVENSPEGVRAARENGRGLQGFSLMAETSAEAVAALARQGRRFSLVVLDPPRAGARDLAPSLAALDPEAVIYIACHPSVLTRDLPAFVSLGYRPQKFIALDMFPRTSHFEALTILRR